MPPPPFCGGVNPLQPDEFFGCCRGGFMPPQPFEDCSSHGKEFGGVNPPLQLIARCAASDPGAHRPHEDRQTPPQLAALPCAILRPST